MADVTGLPDLSQTVNMGQPMAPGMEDPLEAMRKLAREYIASVNKNEILSVKEKKEFKTTVLKKLKGYIDKFEEIDVKYSTIKEPTEDENDISEEEEDPFKDIFEEDTEKAKADEEKGKLAMEFIAWIKQYKADFIRKIRISKEAASRKQDELAIKKMLSKLNRV